MLSAILLPVYALLAAQIPVRQPEGRTHGFLVLRDTNDKLLASGTSTTSSSGARVTTELQFHFADGSSHHEIAVFTQRRVFQLVSYRLTQKGASFKRPLDLTATVATGQVRVRYTDDDGQEKTIDDRMKLPLDLANGIVPALVSQLDPRAPKTVVSMLVATPKPRLVKLEISPSANDTFTIGGAPMKARRYAVHVDIGGLAGVIAPIVGKQPPDTIIWTADGKVPGFLKSEGPMAQDAPLWRIELASPVWPKQ